MSSTPEGKFKDTIKYRLDKLKAAYRTHSAPAPLYFKFNAGSAYGGATSLDLEGCVRGRYFAAEIKRPDGGKKKLTARQIATMDEVRDSGGAVFLIDSIESRDQFLAWLEEQLR